MLPPADRPADSPELVDDPDLEAALDETDEEPSDEVFAALDAMLRAIGKAVA